MSAAHIERRRALQLLGALGIAGLPLQLLQAASGTHASALAADIDAEALRNLADQYRQTAPNGTAEARVQALLQDAALSLDEVLAQLRTLIATDFQHERVLQLGGWFLSNTEGCVLALASAAPRPA